MCVFLSQNIKIKGTDLICSPQQSVSRHRIEGDEAQDSEEKEPPNFFEEPDSDDGAYLVRNDLTGQVTIASYGSVKDVSEEGDVFELRQQLELAKMSELLYNRWGRSVMNRTAPGSNTKMS